MTICCISTGTARFLAITLNILFFIGSVSLCVLAACAAVNPPPADIAPQRVNSYPEFIVSIGLISIFALSVFFVSTVGLIASGLSNSFLLSMHILCQLALIGAQFIALAFTLTVRKRLHYKLEEMWRGKGSCPEPELGTCTPLVRFQRSEMFLIVTFVVWFFAQVILLISTTILCDRISFEERLAALKVREREEDEED